MTVVTASIGLKDSFADKPAAITTIIVSPIALEAARSIPPIMPGRAAGNITFLMVSDFVAPSPYEPSLKDCGTLEINII